jgi:signal transduction histidine kinase
VQDVTAEIESALRAETLRKRLVETINHEFRTPLAALLGHVELIHDHRDRREDLDPDLAQWLDAIDRSAWRLRDLLDEVAELVNAEDDEPVDRRPRARRAG